MNKVKFSLKKAYYAKATIGENDAISYSTPERIPGAVSIALSPEGDLTSLRADGTDYYVGASNNGYSGDLEMALIPDSFSKDCLGEKEHSTDKTIYEVKSAQPTPFALLFEFEGDSKAVKHVMYTQAELRDVERLLKLDPTNTELLKQKQELLAKSVKDTSDKLKTLKEAEKQAQTQFKEGKISEEQYRALEREIIKTEQSLKTLESQAAKSNATLNKIGNTA